MSGGIPTARAITRDANSNPTVLPPVSSAHGKTYSEWSVLWWQWFLPLTAAQFNACTIGDGGGHVAFLLAGPSACAGTVAPGTSLFFPVASVECSSLEAPPFFGATAADRNTCAKGFFDALAGGTLTVKIDDTELQNLTAYSTISPDFPFTVGPDNVFNISCSGSCTGASTGYGYYLMLNPLPPGSHTIHIVAGNYGIDTTWQLTVGH
jgi:hypothetical protein